jgi:hypothetical protein
LEQVIIARDLSAMEFEGFDFDSNENWLAYVRNIEFSGSADDQASQLRRLQAKWYKKHVVSKHRCGDIVSC